MMINNPKHCQDCGHSDCPRVSDKPAWKRCPYEVFDEMDALRDRENDRKIDIARGK